MAMREEIVQWMLNCGIGIVYVSNNAETTVNEKKEKVKRYVKSEYVDAFMSHIHPEQVEYAVKNNISMIDFDQWQAIQNVLFKNTDNPNDTIPFETALKINNALYEEDIEPMELDVSEGNNNQNSSDSEHIIVKFIEDFPPDDCTPMVESYLLNTNNKQACEFANKVEEIINIYEDGSGIKRKKKKKYDDLCYSDKVDFAVNKALKEFPNLETIPMSIIESWVGA